MLLTLVPRPQTRTHVTDGPPTATVRHWLNRLPHATDDLTPFPPSPVACAGLAPAEADAVARAAGCPDLFIVHAPDHAVRERVIAGIVGAVAAGRTLVLSPNPVAADRIAERLAQCAPGSVVRALADDENPLRPSPVVTRLTSAAIGTAHAEQLKRDAAARVAAADARLSILERLTESAEQLARLDSRAAELVAQREAIDGVVRGETDTPFTARLAALGDAHTALVKGITTEIESLTQKQKEQEAALEALRQQHAESLAEAAKKPGFFSRLIGKGKQGPDPAELAARIATIEAEVAAAAVSIARRHEDVGVAATQLEADRARLVAEEVASRQAEIDALATAVGAERERVRSEIAAAAEPLGALPAVCELPAARYAATHALVEAKERAAEVCRTAPEVARRAIAEIAAVVGTPGSLTADPAFDRDPPPDGARPFSLLILDRAEELTEPDFVHLSKFADRWVLVGDASHAEEPNPQANGTPPRHAPGRNGRPVEPSFTAGLARFLDRETWASEGDRLVCRLFHVPPDRRRSLTREPLLDRPEIELRFALDDDAQPVVAEVAFPAATGAAAAKSFLFHQLGEVLLRPCGVPRWDHSGNAITASWSVADQPTADSTWIDLEPGVRERVVGNGTTAFTAAVSFDPAAGWDADRAAEWLSEHARPESPGRFAAVPRTGRPPY